MENPVFTTFIAWSSLLVVKMMLLAPATGFMRFKTGVIKIRILLFFHAHHFLSRRKKKTAQTIPFRTLSIGFWIRNSFIRNSKFQFQRKSEPVSFIFLIWIGKHWVNNFCFLFPILFYKFLKSIQYEITLHTSWILYFAEFEHSIVFTYNS